MKYRISLLGIQSGDVYFVYFITNVPPLYVVLLLGLLKPLLYTGTKRKDIIISIPLIGIGNT